MEQNACTRYNTYQNICQDELNSQPLVTTIFLLVQATCEKKTCQCGHKQTFPIFVSVAIAVATTAIVIDIVCRCQETAPPRQRIVLLSYNKLVAIML